MRKAAQHGISQQDMTHAIKRQDLANGAAS
jgi:hypothetical protein